MAEDRWWESALCAQTDPSLFYLAVGDNGPVAKKICTHCEVRLQCLSEELSFKTPGPGIFGGFGVAERRRLRKRVERGEDPDEVAIQAMERAS